jgi:tRNA(adenine34) deaminase
MSISYEDAMGAALIEAQHAMVDCDVPVGAVVLHNGQIIASAHNQREKLQDPSAHAEVLALRMAAEKLGRWRLDDCDLVVTLEPCVMCAGTILNARIRTLVFGALEPKTGATSSLYNVCSDPRTNHETTVISGIRSQEASELLTRFFNDRRDSTASSAR